MTRTTNCDEEEAAMTWLLLLLLRLLVTAGRDCNKWQVDSLS